MTPKNALSLFRSALFCLLLSAGTLSHAETVGEVAEKTSLANINALLIFTTHEGLNSGHYRFTNVGVKMDMIHLPFEYHFDNSGSDVNTFLLGNVGYSKTTRLERVEIPPDAVINYDSKMQTYTGGIGYGIRYRLDTAWSLQGGVEFIYSRSGLKVQQPDDNVGDAIEDFFDSNFNDHLTYKFFGDLIYDTKWKGYTTYARLSFKLYETKSSFTFEELADFRSQSLVTSLKTGMETHSLYTLGNDYLTLEGYVGYNHLNGEVTTVARLNDYGVVGAVAYWYTPQLEWSERFYLELSAVRGYGIEGYNAGIGLTVDF
jgi:hypothetical protein